MKISLNSLRKSLTAALCIASAGSLFAQAQVCPSTIERTRPDSRYEAVSGATPAGSEVRDKVTGLIWKRCLEGATWSGTACTGAASTFTWVNALDRARTATATTASPASAWRLPNRNELLSLAEIACHNPAINSTWFPNQPSTSAWSASPVEDSAGYAWFVYFLNGFDGYDVKSFGLSARLVRSGQ